MFYICSWLVAEAGALVPHTSEMTAANGPEPPRTQHQEIGLPPARIGHEPVDLCR